MAAWSFTGGKTFLSSLHPSQAVYRQRSDHLFFCCLFPSLTLSLVAWLKGRKKKQTHLLFQCVFIGEAGEWERAEFVFLIFKNVFFSLPLPPIKCFYIIKISGYRNERRGEMKILQLCIQFYSRVQNFFGVPCCGEFR